MKTKWISCLAAATLAVAAGSASAAVSLYGDKDGFADFSGFAGTITDQAVGGPQSWTQTFAVSGTITSATIEIGAAALGFFPPAGVPRLFIDGILIGSLTDMDACDGSGAPGVTGCGASNYTIDLLSVGAIGTLVDGIANVSIETGSGDGWVLDFSEITVTTAVPVPSAAWLALLGLAGVAATRRRR